MINEDNFKPNLVPNHPKKVDVDIDTPIMKNGGYKMYAAIFKKDGVRLELGFNKVVGRSLKEPGSKLVIKRFQEFADKCTELNILLEGEFYMHGYKFNAINRFYKKSDCTDPKYKEELEKAFAKDPKKFNKKYDGLSVEFLTTFHKDLKFWLFDGIVLDAPGLIGWQDRMTEIYFRLQKAGYNLLDNDLFVTPKVYWVNNKEEADELYERALKEGWEGLIFIHVHHEYKCGRNSLNEGTLLKLKDDRREYDGIVLDVMEATQVKEGVAKTRNELGRSVTSKKKGDREDSGIAKGFLVEFEGLGTYTVGLQGFDTEDKRELLENKDKYIGRHFRYTGMPPVKDFPRNAYWDCWRDEK